MIWKRWTQAVHSVPDLQGTAWRMVFAVRWRTTGGSYRVGFSDPAQPRRYSDEYFENALWVAGAQTLIFSKGETRSMDLDARLAMSTTIREHQ